MNSSSEQHDDFRTVSTECQCARECSSLYSSDTQQKTLKRGATHRSCVLKVTGYVMWSSDKAAHASLLQQWPLPSLAHPPPRLLLPTALLPPGHHHPAHALTTAATTPTATTPTATIHLFFPIQAVSEIGCSLFKGNGPPADERILLLT